MNRYCLKSYWIKNMLLFFIIYVSSVHLQSEIFRLTPEKLFASLLLKINFLQFHLLAVFMFEFCRLKLTFNVRVCLSLDQEFSAEKVDGVLFKYYNV